ncbi:MAG: OmpA family protein [Taibaiella sp.]|nr:OmpA family protein [Taibaiella sp.]
MLFEINSTVLEHSSYPILQDAVRRLNADPDAYVIVDGHNDNTGTRPYNKKLSIKRADAVKKHLIELGIKLGK